MNVGGALGGWALARQQLDTTKRHPILQCFDDITEPSCFWAGHGAHLIFVIGDRLQDRFLQICRVVQEMLFLLSTQNVRATWQRGLVSWPACTQLTVYVRTSNPALSEHQTFFNAKGVLIEELFQLIAGTCKAALCVTSDGDMPRWLWRYHECGECYSCLCGKVITDHVPNAAEAMQKEAIKMIADFGELFVGMDIDSFKVS